jgi:hypothetical protein
VARRRARSIRRTDRSAMAIAIDDAAIAESGWLRLFPKTARDVPRLNAGRISALMQSWTAMPISLGGWGVAQSPLSLDVPRVVAGLPNNAGRATDIVAFVDIEAETLSDHDRLAAAARFRAELASMLPAPATAPKRARPMTAIYAAGLGVLLLILMVVLWAPSVVIIKGSGLRTPAAQQATE